MAAIDLTVYMPSDWLKWEEDGWFSRENGILAAASSDIPSGSVLAKNAGGKLIAIAPGASDGTQTPVGILLFTQPLSVADLRVAYIARDAIVADKALKFPDGTTDPQKTAAFTALASLGIQVREAV